MKRIFIMDDDGLKEYVPVESLKNNLAPKLEDKDNENQTENEMLTIADLVKKFKVTRPTIYSWMEKGLLKKIPIGGRVLFHPNDINELIDRLRGISS
ncbi:helix-turn-helix domain-containing protein [Maribacter sp. PR1]|jgi:predicted DNA-binding transcriptional regulator AlpA|uniref:Helix-turn-helix domain-containing protein n=1 Tax=Maribacter cobaltidurans TaxID=1178778 RepID=A0ABU7IYI0_9FLAO|nr:MULTISPECIES: helix-turn-helix domain-containing protein [Maribacter]MDC6390648.1 helix-turn-helix domain-containing protein [Maribacter sp. PR1]MEE1978040.1 helix-turn-helix domain-containing protein [Maribacter cobaltidurans]